MVAVVAQSVLMQVVALILGTVFAIPVVLRLLWAAIVGLGRPCCPPRQKRYPADLLLDPRWGTHGHVTANGVRFHYVAKGPDNAPLMLCLHGFPECWYSWRHYLQAFSNTYRVVAVDLRGFGETSRGEPSYWNKSDYRMEVLVEDVRSIIAALGREKCTLVAHDWGALIAWSFVHAHAAMVEKLVIMDVPHPTAYSKALTVGQLLRSFYIFVFQLPWLPEVWARFGDYSLTYASLWSRSSGIRNRGDPLALTQREVKEVYQYYVSQAGTVSASLNYYRNTFGPNLVYNARLRMTRSHPVPMPTLIVWGQEDGALSPHLATESAKYCADAQVHIIPGASHWVQQDAVQEVVNKVAAFLGATPLPLSGITATPVPVPAPATAAGSIPVTTASPTHSGGGARSRKSVAGEAKPV